LHVFPIWQPRRLRKNLQGVHRPTTWYRDPTLSKSRGISQSTSAAVLEAGIGGGSGITTGALVGKAADDALSAPETNPPKALWGTSDFIMCAGIMPGLHAILSAEFGPLAPCSAGVSVGPGKNKSSDSDGGALRSGGATSAASLLIDARLNSMPECHGCRRACSKSRCRPAAYLRTSGRNTPGMIRNLDPAAHTSTADGGHIHVFVLDGLARQEAEYTRALARYIRGSSIDVDMLAVVR